MAAKQSDGSKKCSINSFLKRFNMEDAEFCRQMGGLARQNVRYWREAGYFIIYNESTGRVRLMKPESELKSFIIKAIKKARAEV